MTGQKPPVFRSAWNAYVDAVRAIAAMPTLTLIVLVIGLAYGLLDYAVGNAVGTEIEKGFAPLLAVFVTSMVWNFFLTPICIAIHRFIVLGEVTTHYVLQPRDPRFLKFFGWSLFLLALVLVPSLLIPLASKSSVGVPAVAAALMIGFLFVAARSIILFPAVAVDAPGATWSNAFADTKGCFWRILGILVLAMLPAAIVGLIVLFATLPSVDDPSAEEELAKASLAASLIASALLIAAAALAVAAASRLYEALGEGVRRAA